MYKRPNRNKEATIGYRYLMPSICGFFLFSLAPFFVVIIASFCSTGIGSIHVDGLGNYHTLFSSQAFRLAMWNTFRFMIIGIPLVILFAMIIALLLNDIEKRDSIAFSILVSLNLLPMVLPSGSVMLFYRVVFERFGLANSIIQQHGGAPLDWLHGEAAFYILILLYVWKNYGYCMILFLAGLKNEDRAIYEAASIDGAGGVIRFIYLTVPSLTPIILLSILLSIMNVFLVYRESFLLLGDYPNSAIYMLPNFLMNSFKSFNLNQMYAATTIFVFCSTIIVSIAIRFGRIGRRVS